MSKCPIHKSESVNLFPADGTSNLTPYTNVPTPAWVKTEPMINQMAKLIKKKLKPMKTSLFKSTFKY